MSATSTTERVGTLLVASLLIACGGSGESAPGGADSAAQPDVGGELDAPVGDAVDDTADSVSSDTGPDASCRWSAYDEGLAGGLIGTVAYAPQKGGAAFAVAGRYVYRSGATISTWDKVGEAPGGIRDFAFSPSVADDIYGASGNGVARSRDGGKTWSTEGLSGVSLSSMFVHPAEALRLFTGTSRSGIFRSLDGGTAWAGTPIPNYQTEISSFAGPTTKRDEVLASYVELNDAGGWSLSGGILRSTNGGTSWTRVFDGGRVHRVLNCPSVPGLYWAATGRGLAKSIDGGVSWSMVLADRYFGDLAIAGDTCATIYATEAPSGVIRSDDGGNTWSGTLATGFQLGPDNRAPQRIVANPHSPDEALAATFGGLYFTTNKGSLWTNSPGIKNLLIWGFAADATDVYLAAYGTGLWQRPIAGGPWSRLPGLTDDYARGVYPSSDGSILFVAARPLFRSVDKGKSFTSVMTDVVMALAFHPVSVNTVYVATQTAGVKKSIDGGVTWAPLNDGLSAWPTSAGTFIDVRGIVIDPTTPTNMVIATNGRGLFRTTDGATWTPTASSLTTASVPYLVRVASSGELFALVGGAGVARSTDFGATWTYLNDGLPTLEVAITVDHTTGDVYATSGKGIQVLHRGAMSWAPVDNSCAPFAGYGGGIVVGRDLVLASSGTTIRLAL